MRINIRLLHVFLTTPLMPKACKTKGERICNITAVRVQEKKGTWEREINSCDWGVSNWYLSTTVVLCGRDTWKHKMKLQNIVLVDFSQEDVTLLPSTKPPVVIPAITTSASHSEHWAMLSTFAVLASLPSFGQNAACWITSSSML